MTVKQSNSYLEFDERRYAAVPFWFWNGKQNKTQITSQLEKAAAGGLRGMAIHARVGNQTEYMSEEWLDLYRHACAEAKRLGLEIWLYDDEDFPSGLVGHRLPRKGAEYCQRSLEFTCCTLSEAAAIDDVVRVFRKDDPSVMISDFSTCDPHTQVLVFYRFIKVDDQVDYLCRKTCEEFMNMTHRKYLEALPEYIGKGVGTAIICTLERRGLRS